MIVVISLVILSRILTKKAFIMINDTHITHYSTRTSDNNTVSDNNITTMITMMIMIIVIRLSMNDDCGKHKYINI